jgi:hypothetical protein
MPADTPTFVHGGYHNPSIDSCVLCRLEEIAARPKLIGGDVD